MLVLFCSQAPLPPILQIHELFFLDRQSIPAIFTNTVPMF